MKYLLDTNVVIDFLTGRHPTVAQRLRTLSPEDLAISSIAVAELRFGADKSARRNESHERIDRVLEDIAALDFDTKAAARYGVLRADLERTGQPIGPNDMLIAAQALSASLILVTDNESEFRKVGELSTENWRS